LRASSSSPFPTVPTVPLVSVVIPLYNKVRYIGRALDSVLAQTFSDFEVIVVNDGSTDGSGKAVEQYTDPRIRLVHREHVNSAGGHAARNLGIAEARADLVAFLDADDEWLPEHLEAILRMRQRFPDCGAYTTARRIIEKGGRRWTPAFATIPESPWEGIIPNYFRTVLLEGDPVNSSSVVIPKRVFDCVGLFPAGVLRGGDTDMWCRIALTYPIAFSTQVGEICHREVEGRISHSPKPRELRVIESLKRALELGTLPTEVPRVDVVEYKNKLHIICASRCIHAGLSMKAREHLRAAVSTGLFRRTRRFMYVLTFVPGTLARWALRIMRRSAKSVSA